ncbi:ABC transporter substrate-binding protein [Aminobacter anthyllidis]|uniref:ABC transporter substrate-binding protein n=1 Tax=Aminobacter anthyllidis TaxID=1035067 RepID=A0A9X1AGQ2_9HYPH|nr:ABC transporter substrate-binding protein [Aminobacter anthyllidis]MBT1159669.1 ABC transporter substrate-binding protein [Aminobacter anthyllidis]
MTLGSRRNFHAAALLCAIALPEYAVAAEMGSTDPIKMAMNEWTSQNILAQVAGRLLSKAGYVVEYVTAGSNTQLTPLSAGELTVAMEIWTVNSGPAFEQLVDEGKITIVGPTGLEGKGGWVYPKFAEGLCPGLPKWEALKDCSGVFSTIETYPQGQLIDFPPDWGNTYSAERFTAFGLDFKSVSGGSEGAITAALRSSIAAKKPVLAYFWWPHPIFAELELAHVEMPAWAAECETDPSWGINPSATYDCDERPNAIVIAAWPGMKDKWPRAYEILEQFRIDNDEDMRLAHEVENGAKLGAVADEWMTKHATQWRAWLDHASK